jgi:hypothetical protein
MKIDHQHDNVHLFEYNIAFGKDDTTVPDEKSWSDQGLVKRYNIFKTIEEAKESLTDEKRLKKWS